MAVNLSQVREMLLPAHRKHDDEKDVVTVRDSSDQVISWWLTGSTKKKEKDMEGKMKIMFEYSTPGAAVGEEHILRLETDQDSMEPIAIVQISGTTKKCVRLSQKEAKMLWKAFRDLDNTYDFFDSF